MAEGDGHYESLALEQVDDATYDTLQTKTKKEKDLLRLLRSDIRRNKRFGVGVGLFCVVLALLNVAVPLYLHQSNMVERQQLLSRLERLQNEHLDLTQQKGQLQSHCDVLQSNLSLLETSCDKLESSRDKLETRFDKLETVRYEFLTGEREQFETKINNMTERLCEIPGWQKFDGGCFYISTNMKNWEESRQWCRDRQSDLVTIKSKEKQDFVASFKKTMWLGLTDTVVEGSFRWVDGTPLTTPTYWNRGEPNNDYGGHSENCVSYDWSEGGSSSTGWNDVSCSDTYTYWMCERAL